MKRKLPSRPPKPTWKATRSTFCTKVTSPIDGKVSRYFFTIGNLVNQDNTLPDQGRLPRIGESMLLWILRCAFR